VKQKLLVIELWGVGDLAIATPFLRLASGKYEVTLLAKSYATDLQSRFWPLIKVISFHAPWTAFDHKYQLWAWPWRRMSRLWAELRRERFDVALSARWDPRDHLLLRLSGARTRLGFPRTGSQTFLTRSLGTPPPLAHRYEYWRVIARALGLDLADRTQVPPLAASARAVFIHTGAGQLVRVWPLERYRQIAARLRALGYAVRIVCNPEQRDWWIASGEQGVAVPHTIAALLDLMADAGVFIGNDSGPGHLAAGSGIPTLTFFGPQVPEWFVPLHPAAEWIEGKACPYKPCSDYCMFPSPICLDQVTEAEAWPRVLAFVQKHLPA
jgi:ADP-heptose:LPS heptosyltransferase